MNNRLYLYCVDTSKEMLRQTKNYLIKHKIKDFETKKASACDLPIKNDSLDCVFSFNAIHHFNLPEFLNEVSRILKDKGYLFIYTRLKLGGQWEVKCSPPCKIGKNVTYFLEINPFSSSFSSDI